MKNSRSAGILLHPTSLPSSYCIGELGSSAFLFIDFLEKSGIGNWQILPLGPTGYGDSPYAALSTFAGNPFLISLERLLEGGLLSPSDLETYPESDPGRVDFRLVTEWKLPLLEKAADNFIRESISEDMSAYSSFCLENSFWLDDFALFVAVKEHFDRKAQEEEVSDSRWNFYWDSDIASREKSAMDRWRKKYKKRIEQLKVLQFFFFRQWTEVKSYANSKGISIIGDIPIFVAAGSSDLWSRRELFHVDKDGRPTFVAGVPPDYFSKTGQLWGNPLYKWKVHEEDSFSWWQSRIESMLKLVDVVRIDHFIGLEAYWEIPADAPTAETGQWVKAPGDKMFRTLKKTLGKLPFIAEDLGVLTPEVEALRDRYGLPGMKILQFAFTFDGKGNQDNENIFLPYNYISNTVVYTGTHDNDTTRGWYNSVTDKERDLVRRYLARPDDDIVWDLIREAFSSVADLAVVPMQDLLDLGSEARMNIPSTLGGNNWTWRMTYNDMNDFVSSRIREMVSLYGRMAE